MGAMLNLIRWLFRPTVLIIISGLLVATAALVVFRSDSGAVRPQRLPLESGDSEIAFIYPATISTSWDRFVAAVRRGCDRLQTTHPGLRVHEVATPGGAGGTATAEVILDGFPGGRRLVFRWYKLTSDWTPEVWMKELLRRPPYPLAIIGGNNSHWARELAVSLRDNSSAIPASDRPLLLLTTATADKVASPENPDEEIDLNRIYDRTYRFSFTNRQMATAVTRFVWSEPDLRPQGDPVYLVQWMDDSYSKDLFSGYARVLPYRATEDVLQRAMFTAGCFGMGLPPAALAGWWTSGTRDDGDGLSFRVLSSVGSFSSPNPYESECAQHLLSDLKDKRDGPDVRRRLLVVTGQAGPSRRFLRDLARSWPDAARRLVVAGGDAISFNTVYRDRMLTWPIQDLPFTLVFFCHRNPISPGAGFRPLDDSGPLAGRPSSQSGTEDLLQFTDIVESVSLAFGEEERNAAALAAGFDRLHLADQTQDRPEGQLTLEERGRPLFSERNKGMRNSGTGEHVVCLRPHFAGERVLPKATREVWARGTAEENGQPWVRIGNRNSPLTVSYVERKASGERIP
jgi:hypothetical protein